MGNHNIDDASCMQSFLGLFFALTLGYDHSPFFSLLSSVCCRAIQDGGPASVGADRIQLRAALLSDV